MKEKEFAFNEEDVRFHYRLLNHRNLSELRILKRGMYPVCRIVKDEDKFVEVCRQWNGKRNIYIGLRDRREGLKSCGRTEDIVGLQSVVIDIDPIRESETPSTKQELESAIEISKIIRKWFVKNCYEAPYIGITGNGCCLYFLVPFYEIDDKNRYDITHKIENFEKLLRNTFKKDLKHFNCNIDRMYDLPRIIRVIGTHNIKGRSTSKRPWRLSYWLEKTKIRQEDKKLLQFILNFKPFS